MKLGWFIYGFVMGVGCVVLGFGLWFHTADHMFAGGVTMGAASWVALISGAFTA